MNSLVRTLVPRISRSFSTSWRAQIENKVKQQQRIFQEPDGLPVHLKGGQRPRIIYMLTLVMTGAGTVWACGDLVYMCFKKS